MTVEIIRLTDSNIAKYRECLNLFGVEFEDEESYCQSQPCDTYVKKLLAKPTFILLAAIQKNKVVGALAAYELEKFEQERSELYIYDLAVAQTHRQQGIATSLIETLQPIAIECGAWVIYVQADMDDEAPTNLYAKLGTREAVLHFDIPVRLRGF